MAACLQYVFRVENDNDFRPETNGEHRLLHDLLPFCRTVFDVGACGGEWADKVLEINPGVVVHCFEPILEAQVALSFKVGGRAFINGFALGREAGEKTFYSVAADLQLSSSFERPGFDPAVMRASKVEVLPLTDYCARSGVDYIDFLKIDVEGAEMDVLEGGIELFRQNRIMAVQFEYGGTWIPARRQLRDVFDLLAGSDYAIAKLMPTGFRVIDTYDTALDNFRYSNWLILQREIAESGGLGA
jgi:FkbM family methyltransferase